MHAKIKQGIDNCYLAHRYEHPGYEEDRCAGLRTLNGCGEPIDTCKQCVLYYGNKKIRIGEWIPCSERLPDDVDERFYMCTVENHEEDPPMFCQYEEEYGFGFWNDIYDEHTLGFVDSEFKTNEELGYEKVVAWMPLPEPYKGECDEEE